MSPPPIRKRIMSGNVAGLSEEEFVVYAAAERNSADCESAALSPACTVSIDAAVIEVGA